MAFVSRTQLTTTSLTTTASQTATGSISRVRAIASYLTTTAPQIDTGASILPLSPIITSYPVITAQRTERASPSGSIITSYPTIPVSQTVTRASVYRAATTPYQTIPAPITCMASVSRIVCVITRYPATIVSQMTSASIYCIVMIPLYPGTTAP